MSKKNSHITQPTKLLINNIISNQKIMPKTAAKRKEVNGESNEEVASRRGRFPRGTAAVESPVVPLVVMPESASHARVSTPSSIETSPPSNLSTVFYAESTAFIKKSTSSVIKKKAEYIDFCDSAQVKKECLKYIKTAAELPVD